MAKNKWGRPIEVGGLADKIQFVLKLSQERPITPPEAVERILERYPDISLHYALQLCYQHAPRVGAKWIPATKKSNYPLTRQKRKEEKERKAKIKKASTKIAILDDGY